MGVALTTSRSAPDDAVEVPNLLGGGVLGLGGNGSPGSHPPAFRRVPFGRHRVHE